MQWNMYLQDELENVQAPPLLMHSWQWDVYILGGITGMQTCLLEAGYKQR